MRILVVNDLLQGGGVEKLMYDMVMHLHKNHEITILTDKRDFEWEKENLKQKVMSFQQAGPENCSSHPHPFFGKLTPEQWGKGIYKHLDHHLKQFDV